MRNGEQAEERPTDFARLLLVDYLERLGRLAHLSDPAKERQYALAVRAFMRLSPVRGPLHE